jgi:large subunit ribosomal protein L16
LKQFPSKLKYKKNHKLSKKDSYLLDQKIFYPKKGLFGLVLKESAKLTFNQIEASRKSIRRNVKKKGDLSMHVFTNFFVTKKSIASRMGKGKGNHNIWICPVRKGQLIAELSKTVLWQSNIALNSASCKMPVKSQFIKLKY